MRRSQVIALKLQLRLDKSFIFGVFIFFICEFPNQADVKFTSLEFANTGRLLAKDAYIVQMNDRKVSDSLRKLIFLDKDRVFQHLLINSVAAPGEKILYSP